MIERSRHLPGVLRILEPALCLRCRFAWLIEAEDENGEQSQMFYCSRGDCDNWVTKPEKDQPRPQGSQADSASL